MGTLQSAYFNTQIGDYVFDAFFSVQHDTTLTITKHPVQTGASVSDHAYMEPKQLTFEIGMSDVMQSIISGQFTDHQSRSVSAYNTLRKLQEQRIPVQVVTRLGVYQNMLIETISAPDDYKTMYGLKATVTMQEILVVQVATVKISARPHKSNSTNNGDQMAQKADSSFLSSLFN
jgi:hypothetical protein